MTRTAFRTLAAGTALVFATVTPMLVTAHAAGAAVSTDRGTTQQATPASRGLILRGLHRATTGRCHGGYEVAGHAGMCSPGPDAGPEGVDVRAPRSGGGGGEPQTPPAPSPPPPPPRSPTPPPAPGPRGTHGHPGAAGFAAASPV